MNDLRPFTVFAIVAIAVFVGVLDIAFAHIGGNKSTISRVMLAGQEQNPMMALLLCYAFAGLMAHLFWPVVAPFPSTFTTVWKSLVFMLPIFYLVYAVARIQFQPVEMRGLLGWSETLRLPFVRYGDPVVYEMVAGSIVGFFAARIFVPQHVWPGIN